MLQTDRLFEHYIPIYQSSFHYTISCFRSRNEQMGIGKEEEVTVHCQKGSTSRICPEKKMPFVEEY